MARIRILLLVALSIFAAPRASNAQTSDADSIIGGTVELFERLVDMHWHKGEYDHMVNVGRMALTANPDDLEMTSNIAWILWSMSRDQEAMDVYTASIKRNPKTYTIYDEVGNYYSNRKRDWAKALPYYVKAANCKDAPPASLHILARAYEKNNDMIHALSTWEKAVATPNNPAAAAARANLARVQAKINNR
jgi:tetratricopeptide (TPR) repeat protein